jgi:ribosome-associated protein
MLIITPTIFLNEAELEFNFIRAPGPGGQNVNKVATAVQLRFNLQNSTSFPVDVQARLLMSLANKITREGDIIIKASRFRTQERNKQDAINRLCELLKRGASVPKRRKKTKPTFGSVQQRLNKKKLHGKRKSLRRKKPSADD